MSRNLDKNVFIAKKPSIKQGLPVEMKRLSTAAFISMLLVSAIAGTIFAKLARANPFLDYNFDVSPPAGMQPQTIKITSPENNTGYNSNDLTLSFNVSLNYEKTWYNIFIYSVYYKASWLDDNVSVYRWSYHDLWNTEDNDPYLTECSQDLNLTKVPDGRQNITITAYATGSYVKSLVYYEFHTKISSLVVFTIDITPPSVSVLSLKNVTYETTDVPLNFAINEAVSKIKYSLDGQENVTIVGNITLTGLPNGDHNVTVYATDEFGNTGASEVIYFRVDVPFPVAPVAVVSGTSVAIVSAGLLVYFKKRKREPGDET